MRLVKPAAPSPLGVNDAGLGGQGQRRALGVTKEPQRSGCRAWPDWEVALFLNFGLEACEILLPQPGIELRPLALEGKVLTTGPPDKSPVGSILYVNPRKLTQWGRGSKRGGGVQAVPTSLHPGSWKLIFSTFGRPRNDVSTHLSLEESVVQNGITNFPRIGA